MQTGCSSLQECTVTQLTVVCKVNEVVAYAFRCGDLPLQELVHIVDQKLRAEEPIGGLVLLNTGKMVLGNYMLQAYAGEVMVYVR